MKQAIVSDIVGIINKKYPFALAEEWDNVGLQLGEPTAAVNRIMVALDPLPEVLDEAITQNCDLLVTHHPLILSPLRQLTTTTTTGSSILKALRADLNLIAMHTNYDIADNGLNDLLASRIGLKKTRPLKITGRDELVKLVVFVPAEQLESVRSALLPYAKSLGKYRECSFAAAGEGTFLPLDGAQPAIGTIGKPERVTEQRLELLVQRPRLSHAVKALMAAHPYEEPAFDCYPLLNEAPPIGLGRVGNLTQPLTAQEFACVVARQLGSTNMRLVGNPLRTVRKIALCSGSGASLLRDALRAGADLLLTGDIKYHEAREAAAQGLLLLDAGHFATEHLMADEIRTFLDTALRQAGYQAELLTAGCEHDPFIPVTL